MLLLIPIVGPLIGIPLAIFWAITSPAQISVLSTPLMPILKILFLAELF